MSNTGNATHNTVTLSGNPDLSASNIYGGRSSSGDAFTGNTLNVHGGHVVKSVQNFEYMNFYVPTTMGNGGIMLTTTDSVDISNVTVNVGVEGSRSPLKTGDHVVLIDVLYGNLSGKTVNDTANGQGMHGVTLRYDFDVLVPGSNPDQLWARLRTIIVNPQDQAFSDGFLAGGTLLNQGGNSIAGNGLNSAVHAAWRERNCGWATFGDFSGGWSRIDVGMGTSVDMNSLSALGGISRCMRWNSSRLTSGLFFEYGNGSYDSTRKFYDAAPVRSKGSLDHIGGGVLARWDFDKAMKFFVDGSFRMGNLHNKFSSDMRDSLGVAAGFHANSMYYGGHIGAGKTWHFANNSFDLYGKYLWSQTQGTSVLLTTGEPVDFESVNSHCFRVGGRYNVGMNNRLTPYFGAAWEHEFGGLSRASTNGYAIDAPSLRGGMGIGELGIALKPMNNHGFYFDLGVQAYTGKRDGVTAGLFIGRSF